VARRLRLDAELVRRGLARSRDHAAELIRARRVTVGGVTAEKPATSVGTDAALVVAADDDDPGYASRGGFKLAGALDAFAAAGLSVQDRSAVDAGASTGGFTDVLLRRGASRVVAVDVGYGQLAWPLRQDDRVTVLDRTNVRDLTVEQVEGPVDVVVADLSFISLATVLPPLAGITAADGDLVLMVKPQFEVGRARLAKTGVVRDPELRADAVLNVAGRAWELGLGVMGVSASPLPGPAGNVEYFLWLRHEAPAVVPQDVRAVVLEGPQ
jgi:23S rRNA (cytidine1920-2'-O)/16S rRNA (cytidine1409-2'-O)-methyltransferase